MTYPEPSIDPPFPETLDYCKYCGGEIYEYDEIVELDGWRYHLDCFSDASVGILLEDYGAVVKTMELERGIHI